MEFAQVGRGLVVAGLGLAVLGAFVWGVGTLAPGAKLGRLPGDLVFESGGVKVFVPLATMLLASLLLTLMIWILSAVRK